MDARPAERNLGWVPGTAPAQSFFNKPEPHVGAMGSMS
jgi:hypothetical protein